MVSRPISELKRNDGIAYCNQRCRTTAFWAGPIREKLTNGLKASPSVHSPERLAHLKKCRDQRGPATEEFRAKIRAARMRQHFPTKMTSIEKAMASALDAEGIPYVMHMPFMGKWQPDFTILSTHIMIQADGDYWHRRPLQIERDAAFNEAARTDGWSVLRFWENEINTNIDGCIATIVLKIREKEGRLS